MLSFEEAIRLLIQRSGLTQEQIAAKVGRQRNYIHRMFKRWPNVTIGEVALLVHVLGGRLKIELARNEVMFEVGNMREGA